MFRIPGMPSRKRRLPSCPECDKHLFFSNEKGKVFQLGTGRDARAFCDKHNQDIAMLFPNRAARRSKRPIFA